MPFSVACHLCAKKFKTGVSLKKHSILKHRESYLDNVQFLDESNSPCEQLKAPHLLTKKLKIILNGLGFWWSESMDHWYRSSK